MVLLAILGVVHSNAFGLFSSDTHRGWLRKLGAFAYVNMRRLYKPFGSQLHNLGERNAFLRAVTRRKPSYAFPIHLRVTSGHCGKQTQQKISQIQICRAYKISKKQLSAWTTLSGWNHEFDQVTTCASDRPHVSNQLVCNAKACLWLFAMIHVVWNVALGFKRLSRHGVT